MTEPRRVIVTKPQPNKEDILEIPEDKVPSETQIQTLANRVDLRYGGNMDRKAMFLPDQYLYSYAVCMDSEGQQVLTVRRK